MAETSNVAVVGFFLTFDPAIGMIDGTDAMVSPLVRDGNFFSFRGGLGEAIIFPEVLTGPAAANKLVVVSFSRSPNNPGSGTLELVRDGQIIESQQIYFPPASFIFSR